ncbi:c-type cytochrome [Billgrantia kenyensis]|uniref:C-type cytochrome n=1 Tax=Billgrantia kenyensis TaxID=321266 RepID=A0A7V9W1Z3_9GAMM|nr:c-type cytochrome [Halomonas kenyensis]MBA2779566.1 c-type cytochrome [Halomonas kenyensis]MCG6662278.1 c-type cytochrome [Halomonas kenyensis]
MSKIFTPRPFQAENPAVLNSTRHSALLVALLVSAAMSVTSHSSLADDRGHGDHAHGHTDHSHTHDNEEDHAGHDHGGEDDHAAHDHAAHDHGGQDDHAAHDHGGEDEHAAHDHGGQDDHAAHDHGGEDDHAAHDHDHDRGIPEDWLTRENPLPLTDEVLASGQQIYRQYCSACHGPSGQGDGLAPATRDFDPSPTDLALHGPAHAAGEYAWIIGEGNPASAMPSFGSKLDEEQVWSVIHYIRHGMSIKSDTEGDPSHQH